MTGDLWPAHVLRFCDGEVHEEGDRSVTIHPKFQGFQGDVQP